MKSINQLSEEVHSLAKDKGWWEGHTRSPLDVYMLIVTELAEAAEEARNGKEEIYYNEDKPGKPEGQVIELADAVIRIMDYCIFRGWDLEAAITQKHEYNKSRAYRHGGKEILMTKIINIYGGPGSGKSSIASDVYSRLKRQGENVELVREYIKDWVWEGVPLTKYDQFYITVKQCRGMSRLFNKVDIIVTDSPVLLGGAYEEYYHKSNMLAAGLMEYHTEVEEDGHKFINYFLERDPRHFKDEGRYSGLEESQKIDAHIRCYLNDRDQQYTLMTGSHYYIPHLIIEDFNERSKK